VAVYAAAVAAGSLLPIGTPASTPDLLDKVVHLCEYLVLVWLSAEWLRRAGHGHALAAAVVAAVVYGLGLEGVQALIPWRSAELLDVAANTVGACLGAAASWGLGRRAAPHTEGHG